MPKLRALLICTGVLILAACAHAPAGHPLPSAPLEAPPGVVPPAEPSSTYPEGLVPPAAQATEPADATLTETPTQVAGLTPAQYADLFDRMRSGFKIDEVERAAVDQQLNWLPRIRNISSAPSAAPSCTSTTS